MAGADGIQALHKRSKRLNDAGSIRYSIPKCIPVKSVTDDAEAALQQLHTQQRTLEDNLASVLRVRELANWYTYIDGMIVDGPESAKIRIHNLVAEQFNKLDTDIKEANSSPVKSKSRTDVAEHVSRSKAAGKTSVKTKPVGNKMKPSSMSSAGDKLVKPTVRSKTTRNLEHDTRKKTIPQQMRAESFTTLQSRPEAKVQPVNSYHRSSVRQPYLRWGSSQWQMHLPQIMPSHFEGIEMKSAKVQTSEQTSLDDLHDGDERVSPQQKTFRPQSETDQPIPAAISLGITRTPPSSFTASQGSASTPLTRTPATLGTMMSGAVVDDSRRQRNVGFVSVKAGKTKPRLSLQVLPNIEIPSHKADASMDQPNYLLVTEKEEEEVSDTSSTEGDGVLLPGFRQTSPQPHTRPTHLIEPTKLSLHDHQPHGPSSDTLAENLLQRKSVEDKAKQWIEQELLARIVGEMRKADDEQTRHVVDVDVAGSSSEDSRSHGNTTRFLGARGLQAFINAGLQVDGALLESLLKEAILEEIRSLLGERQSPQPSLIPAAEDIPHTESPVAMPPVRSRSITPDVTPTLSPVSSHSSIKEEAEDSPTPQQQPTPDNSRVSEEILKPGMLALEEAESSTVVHTSSPPIAASPTPTPTPLPAPTPPPTSPPSPVPSVPTPSPPSEPSVASPVASERSELSVPDIPNEEENRSRELSPVVVEMVPQTPAEFQLPPKLPSPEPEPSPPSSAAEQTSSVSEESSSVIQDSYTSTGWSLSEGEWLLGGLHTNLHRPGMMPASTDSTMRGIWDIEEDELEPGQVPPGRRAAAAAAADGSIALLLARIDKGLNATVSEEASKGELMYNYSAGELSVAGRYLPMTNHAKVAHVQFELPTSPGEVPHHHGLQGMSYAPLATSECQADAEDNSQLDVVSEGQKLELPLPFHVKTMDHQQDDHSGSDGGSGEVNPIRKPPAVPGAEAVPVTIRRRMSDQPNASKITVTAMDDDDEEEDDSSNTSNNPGNKDIEHNDASTISDRPTSSRLEITALDDSDSDGEELAYEISNEGERSVSSDHAGYSDQIAGQSHDGDGTGTLLGTLHNIPDLIDSS
ncbi:PREDICTED: protein TALPID3-like [Priapulus caudatus]|uniref:Protein TALPID3-like n=1 Tax=Priapulus caudatus TaxID=37621 RepID=A0ABM1E184_PRICU|nr:PREDICTED: protein TALPID3-like [Priapulus caudatus]